MGLLSPPVIERIDLQLIPVWTHRAVDLSLLDIRMELRYLEHEKNLAILDLEAWLAGEEHKRQNAVEVPETWWDHFKLRFFPRWLSARYPAKMRQIITDYSVTYICPHIETKSWQDKQQHIAFIKQPPQKGYY